MKKYLLPLLLILGLAGGLATAQNITKALQLSQDPTGAFGVDTSNNVYFPRHVLGGTIGNTPILTSCGSGTPVIAGNDFAGTVTFGTSATTCIITFANAYLAAPSCTLSAQTPANSNLAYGLQTTGINVSQLSQSGNKINYICSGTS